MKHPTGLTALDVKNILKSKENNRFLAWQYNVPVEIIIEIRSAGQ